MCEIEGSKFLCCPRQTLSVAYLKPSRKPRLDLHACYVMCHSKSPSSSVPELDRLDESGPLVLQHGRTLSDPPSLSPLRMLSELRSPRPLYSFFDFQPFAATTRGLTQPWPPAPTPPWDRCSRAGHLPRAPELPLVACIALYVRGDDLAARYEVRRRSEGVVNLRVLLNRHRVVSAPG